MDVTFQFFNRFKTRFLFVGLILLLGRPLLSAQEASPVFVLPAWESIMERYQKKEWNPLILQLQAVVSQPIGDKDYLKRAWFILGQSYLALEEYELAQTSFQAGEQLDETFPSLWIYHRMRVHLRANEQAKAIPLIKTLLQPPINSFYLKKIKANIKNYYQTEKSAPLVYPLLQTALRQFPALLQDHQIIEIFEKSAAHLKKPFPVEAYKIQWLHPHNLKTAQQSAARLAKHKKQIALSSSDYLQRFKKLRKLKLYGYLTQSIPQQIDGVANFQTRTAIANIYLRALFQQKQYRTILNLEKKNILTQKYKAYRTSQLFWSMRSYQRLRQLESAEQTLRVLEKSNPKSTWLPSAYQKMAETYEVLGDPRTADGWWQKLAKTYPNTKEGAKAAWKLVWYPYRGQNYQAALEAIANATAQQTFSAAVLGKFLYWQGKMELLSGKKKQAVQTFKTLQKKAPNTYYSLYFLSHPRWATDLSARVAPSSKLWQPPPQPKGQLAELVQQHAFLFAIGENAHAVFQLKRDVREHKKHSLIWKDSQLLYQHEEYYPLQAFISNYYWNDLKQLSLNQPLWKFAYPRPYWEFVQKQSHKAKIDPYWALAIMREESRYQVDAVSIANARGLMQLIDPTAKEVARQQKIRLASTHSLYDPQINIRLGVHYLGSLAKQFNNQMIYASASYNAGPHRVKKWLKSYADFPMDEFVESIPFDETRNYVKRVFRSYTLYQKIYPTH